MNRRRRPFQGVNNQYLQLLTRHTRPQIYAEIRVKRLNHGWESRVQISAARKGRDGESGTVGNGLEKDALQRNFGLIAHKTRLVGNGGAPQF